MTVKELEAYCQANNIKIGRANKEKLARGLEVLRTTDKYVTMTYDEAERAKLYRFFLNEKKGSVKTYHSESLLLDIYENRPVPMGLYSKFGYNIVYDDSYNKIVSATSNVTIPTKDITKSNCGVYGIYVDRQLVYIGKTMRDFHDRWREHIKLKENSDIDSSQQPFLYSAMRSGNSVEFKILAGMEGGFTNGEIESVECTLIQLYKPKFNYQGVKVPYQFSERKRRRIDWKEIV